MFTDMDIINKDVGNRIDPFETQEKTFAFPFRFYKKRFRIVTHPAIVILFSGKGIPAVPGMRQVYPFFAFKLYLMGKPEHPVLIQQDFLTSCKYRSTDKKKYQTKDRVFHVNKILDLWLKSKCLRVLIPALFV